MSQHLVEQHLAARMRGLQPSAVREILKVAERPEVISFAGGLPAPELFPVQEISRAVADVLSTDGAAALQYGVTEGYAPLRAWIASRLCRMGADSSVERVLITSGSQQGIDLVAKLLLDPGDGVVVEAPTYVAAIQAFSAYEATLYEVPSDQDGMDVDALEDVLRHHGVKLIYVVPEFQNPKGTTLSGPRRQRMVELAAQYGALILSDDPYGELRFRGTPAPLLAALDEERVIRLGTFSKTLAPGLRIGWVHAAREVIRRLAIAKQSSDLHTATITQRGAAKLLETFDYDAHLARIRDSYGARCDAMLAALEREMPAGARWTRPEGGLFIWLELPPGVTDQELFQRAISRDVAVVPGSAFFVTPGDGHDSFVRLNFSNQSIPRIDQGIKRLAEAMAECARGASTHRATGT
ncbi:MAG TPA: PLP-dependent aminotransferase family protein [Myxococcales bacterium]|jgi:2-aminoadipate transaminase|nr:PLP-dependent aminotransferase family protein [Myxococcales bacterium]